jgi:hypothetical protein
MSCPPFDAKGVRVERTRARARREHDHRGDERGGDFPPDFTDSPSHQASTSPVGTSTSGGRQRAPRRGRHRLVGGRRRGCGARRSCPRRGGARTPAGRGDRPGRRGRGPHAGSCGVGGHRHPASPVAEPGRARAGPGAGQPGRRWGARGGEPAQRHGPRRRGPADLRAHERCRPPGGRDRARNIALVPGTRRPQSPPGGDTDGRTPPQRAPTNVAA